jgi:hypothetical protein
MRIAIVGVPQGVQGDAKVHVAGLQRGGRHVTGRHVVEHDDVDGTLGVAGRRLPGDRPFDPTRPTRSETTARWASFSSWGACATPSPAAFCTSALLSYFFKGALLLVR